MKEHFETIAEAKLRRNELLDASAYTQTRSFSGRYTHLSCENADRYLAQLYGVVDSVAEYPADIEWPIEPVYQSKAAFDASMPSTEYSEMS
jgi:hypothetical protein